MYRIKNSYLIPLIKHHFKVSQTPICLKHVLSYLLNNNKSLLRSKDHKFNPPHDQWDLGNLLNHKWVIIRSNKEKKISL